MICHIGGIARLMVLFLCTMWVHYYGFSIITCIASSKHLMVSILICILHVGVNHHTCHRLKCRVSSLLREVVNLSVEATAGKDTGSGLIGATSWISASGWKFPGGALETGWGGGVWSLVFRDLIFQFGLLNRGLDFQAGESFRFVLRIVPSFHLEATAKCSSFFSEQH